MRCFVKGQWFRDAAFGAFIHWGLFSVPGGIWKGRETDYIGEWLQAKFRIPNREYERLAEKFDPAGFDADDWIRQFRDAGMKYIVFTAKHHEGFAMFRTRVSPFNIVDATPFGRDPLAELAAACRKYGLKLGIYYSQFLDWHEPDGGTPGFDARNIDGSSWGNDWDYPDRSKKDFDRYFRGKVIPQITELLTQYGPVGVLWCDCPCDMAEHYCRELRDLVHRLQPECLINSRIGHGCQDYCALGDNQLPASAIPGLAESPMTLNDTWGWKVNDRNWKTPEYIISRLLSLAEKKANLLLNVGPKPDGTFPSETVRILAEIADWYRKNGTVLTRSTGNPFAQELDYAYVLMEGKRLHFFPKRGTGKVVLSGVAGSVETSDLPCRQVAGGLELDFSGVRGVYPKLTVDFAEEPEICKIPMPQNGVLLLSAASCTIVCGEDDLLPENGAAATDADGRIVAAAAHVTATGGALGSWHNPNDRIVWRVRFPERAVYRVFCTTASAVHSKPWTGGRTVEVTCGDSVLRTQLADGESVGTSYHEARRSLLGEIAVRESGECEITLRTAALTDPDATRMNFQSLMFRKVPEAENR